MGKVYKGPGFRTCAHPGCIWPAVSALGYDYDARLAWICDLGSRRDPATYDLCASHTERFSPPRGWEVEDRRETELGVLAVFDAAVSRDEAPAAGLEAPISSSQPELPQPRLGEGGLEAAP